MTQGYEKDSDEERFSSLRRLQQAPVRTFSQAILGHPFARFDVAAAAPLSTAIAEVKTPEVAPLPTEKERTLDSLQKFVEKSTEQSVAVTYEGAKRALLGTKKSDPQVVQTFVVSDEIAGLEMLERPSSGEQLLCAFVGHRLGDEWGHYDILEASDQMLERMIKAMGLAPHEYALAPFKRHLEDPEKDVHWNSLLKGLAAQKPKIVFLMGANVTAAFMGKKERISKLHGQVFKREFQSSGETVSLSLMPIFHPEYLLINTAMKKAAWEDFQKAMELMRS